MNTHLNYLDANVVLAGLGNLGPVDAPSDVADCHPCGIADLELLKLLASQRGNTAPLAVSRYMLRTLALRLEKGGEDFPAYDSSEAPAIVATYWALVRASNGFVVEDDDVAAQMTRVKNAVPAHLHGRGKAQVDDEDMRIIAALLAAMAKTGDPAVTATLTTNDGGFFAASAALARLGIAVVTPRAWMSRTRTGTA